MPNVEQRKIMNKRAGYEYIWIIGGGLLQTPLVSEAKQLGYKIIVSDKNSFCPCAKDSDIFINIDIFDIQAHLEKAFSLKSEGINIKGVIVAGIDCTVTGSVLARALDLPGIDPIIAYITNNKHIFCGTLKKLGYSTVRYKAVGSADLADIANAVKEIGFPLIIKNTDSSGSRGTKIFYNEAPLHEIEHAVEKAQLVSRSKVALIEEFLEGEEFTVETIFDINGEFYPCFITDRIFSKENGYPIELGLRNPTALPMETQKEMYALVKDVAHDIGINIGAAKADMILTNKGISILEMTVRLSGGFDSQFLVPCATGKNVLRAAILTCLGKQFPKHLLEDKKRKVGLTGSIWPEPGKIVAIEGVKEAREIKGFEHIFFRYNVGDVVEPYIDCTKRVCFIIVTGEDETSAKDSLKQVSQAIKIKTIREDF